jgi:hypothetical protein
MAEGAEIRLISVSSLYMLFPEKFMKPPVLQIDGWISK